MLQVGHSTSFFMTSYHLIVTIVLKPNSLNLTFFLVKDIKHLSYAFGKHYGVFYL